MVIVFCWRGVSVNLGEVPQSQFCSNNSARGIVGYKYSKIHPTKLNAIRQLVIETYKYTEMLFFLSSSGFTTTVLFIRCSVHIRKTILLHPTLLSCYSPKSLPISCDAIFFYKVPLYPSDLLILLLYPFTRFGLWLSTGILFLQQFTPLRPSFVKS